MQFDRFKPGEDYGKDLYVLINQGLPAREQPYPAVLDVGGNNTCAGAAGSSKHVLTADRGACHRITVRFYDQQPRSAVSIAFTLLDVTSYAFRSDVVLVQAFRRGELVYDNRQSPSGKPKCYSQAVGEVDTIDILGGSLNQKDLLVLDEISWDE